MVICWSVYITVNYRAVNYGGQGYRDRRSGISLIMTLNYSLACKVNSPYLVYLMRPTFSQIASPFNATPDPGIFNKNITWHRSHAIFAINNLVFVSIINVTMRGLGPDMAFAAVARLHN